MAEDTAASGEHVQDEAYLTALLRSQVYHLLTDSFSRPDEPSGPWAESLVARWQTVVGLMADDAFIFSVQRLSESATADLCRAHDSLFEPHGGLKAPPYETQHTKETPQHAMSQQHEMADIAGFYRAFGFDVANDRCDHLTAELEYLYAMATKEADARASGNTEQVEIVEAAQRDFLKDHLGRWAASLSQSIIEADVSPFYLALAELLEFWIAVDQDYLRASESESRGPGCDPDGDATI